MQGCRLSRGGTLLQLLAPEFADVSDRYCVSVLEPLWGTPSPSDAGPWPVVEARDGTLFADVISIMEPGVLVEFGSWEGSSALAWATAAREHKLQTQIICIDTWLGSPEHWRDSLPGTEWAQDRLRLVQGEPELINTFRNAVHVQGFQAQISPLRATCECGCEYLRLMDVVADVVYVDANHDYRAVAQDLRLANSILSTRGVIIGDDWLHLPVQRAALEFALLKQHDLVVHSQQGGFALISRKRSGQLLERFIEQGFTQENLAAMSLRLATAQTRSIGRRALKGSGS